MTGIGVEAGAQAARSRALAVLRIRSRALAVALLPAAVAVVLLAGGSTGHLMGGFWDTARLAMTVLGALVLLAAGAVALVVARARPAVSPTVSIVEESAPDLYRMVRDLADRLDVPAPSAIALTPDCDSWLEDRTHPAHGPPPQEGREDEIAGVRGSHRRVPAAPVLVIGSPFLWWMRVGELRAVLAPVVAGTGPSAHPDIAAARRFVRGLDAAVAVGSSPGRCPLTRLLCAGVAWVARLLLRSCREHAAQMERGVAAAAAERAQAVDYGLRIVAQEQVGLAYAGWDRLLTRVALPAWRMGRWPSRLDAGVVAALTELSRRDRLAEGFASRLGERPACDLLEEPGAMDEAASLLAARLFHGGPAETGPDWSPVDWQEYPEEVVDRKWRLDAARLHRVLDAQGVSRTQGSTPPESDGPTLSRVLDHLSAPSPTAPTPATRSHDSVPASPHAESAQNHEQAPTHEPAAADGVVSPLQERALAEPPPAPADDRGTTQQEPASLDGPAASLDGAPARQDEPPTAPATPPSESPAPLDDAPTAPATLPSELPAPLDDAPTAPATPPSELPAPLDDAPTAPATLPNEPQPPLDEAPAPPTPPATAPAPPPTAPSPSPPQTEPSAPQPAPPTAHPVSPLLEEPPSPNDPAVADSETAPQRPPTPDRESRADGAEGADSAEGTPSREGEAENLAAALTAEIAREEAAAPPSRTSPDPTPWDDTGLPLFPLQPPRSARELLTDHVTAMVCCAAIDTAGAAPGLDWLDGPSLLVNGERAADLTPRVLALVEDGDPVPLRAWLVKSGIRPEKPVRLV
ncbi:hypothetical protein ACI2L1_34370 [Streptomyces sp. NPDC019531]|uniref:hypothetical protein n=1 Tax=Streptomyces sp. NPDC019531 TaxID=3365062 RepID=UPI00384AB215